MHYEIGCCQMAMPLGRVVRWSRCSCKYMRTSRPKRHGYLTIAGPNIAVDKNWTSMYCSPWNWSQTSLVLLMWKCKFSPCPFLLKLFFHWLLYKLFRKLCQPEKNIEIWFWSTGRLIVPFPKMLVLVTLFSSSLK